MPDPEPTAPDSSDLRASLQSPDPLRVDGAYRTLIREVVDKARMILGSRRGNVHLDSESIAMSVLLREVILKPDRFQNEDHLRGRLFQAVRHKILDRIKSAGAQGIHGISEELADGRQDGASAESAVAEAELAGRVRDLLLRDLSPEDRTIVESCILDDTDSKEVGLRIGISGPAVRKRLERMRPGLRDRLLDLAKRNLAPRDWDLVSALFVERLTPDRCGERFGIPVDRLEAELEDLIQRRIGPALGVLGQLALLRLLGRTRDDTD